jgi:hypothetical protein
MDGKIIGLDSAGKRVGGRQAIDVLGKSVKLKLIR